MIDLEKFMNEESDIPFLIKTGLAHVQFETIHPFLDGNGRIGRLLIVLMLVQEGLLENPILYPSYHFKKHRHEYYQRLDRVRTHGDYEGWISYYLKAIKESARDALLRTQEIEKLEKDLIEKITKDRAFFKIREISLIILSLLFRMPVTTAQELVPLTGKSLNTIKNIINIFQSHHILEETGDLTKAKLFRFVPYLEILEKDIS